MTATFGGRHGMDFVNDHGGDGGESGFCRAGEHQIERFGGGDQNIRRVLHQCAALGCRGVTGAHSHRDLWLADPHLMGGCADACQRGAEVAFHIHAEGFERGNIQDSGPGVVASRFGDPRKCWGGTGGVQ